MRVDPDPDSGTPGSLPFFSFLSKLPDDPAEVSPPPRNRASIPFKWEEAPGKPKMFSSRFLGSRASLTLKLPPRLYGEEEARITRMSSSSSVLHRTYTDFSLPSLGSFGSECWSPINAHQKQQPRTSSFSSWDAMGVCGGNKRSDQEMEFLVQDGDGSNGDEIDTMIRSKKSRRRWKFVNLFRRKSRCWVRSNLDRFK